jgi:hypothetical protein
VICLALLFQGSFPCLKMYGLFPIGVLGVLVQTTTAISTLEVSSEAVDILN